MTHNEVLQAIIDGKKLQRKHLEFSVWQSVTPSQAMVILGRVMDGMPPENEFRIKPEPKPDMVYRDVVYGLERGPMQVVVTVDGETKTVKEVAQIGKPSPSRMEELLWRIYHIDVPTKDDIKEVLNDVTK